MDVDEVVIDLEDAVAPSEKTDTTRRQAAEAIARLAWRAPSIAVRVNGIDTPWFREDVEAVVRLAGSRLACLVLPKVESATALTDAARAIAAAAKAAGQPAPGLEALIETALGVVRVDSIAEAGGGLEALIFGAGDYAASLGLPMAAIGAIDTSFPGDQWAYPRSRISVAAHAFGLDAIDGPYASYRDMDGLAESARRARAVGFSGKWVIHPDQIATCTEVFTPSEEELVAAERILPTTDDLGRAATGVAAVDGTMIDEASRRQAQRVRGRANGTQH